MFQYVHHIQYIVKNLDDMEAYFEKNFGMKPDRRSEHPVHGKEACYEIGDTEIQLTEPVDPTSSTGKYLAQHGPGVYHVAWKVDDVKQVAQDLAAKGNKIRPRGKDQQLVTPTGGPNKYLVCNIDPVSSHGIWFQLIGE